eukprot:TRINITY_DN2431_c0_g1_i15.p1 TRINITY_DN2431_c0_g1~~TRINITY_DN2431_c0_g1_i15.p1  ORF type:complete len:634 (-),score=104.26 TRINITY_DN2431_c0_g1_i15:88-1989(-)
MLKDTSIDFDLCEQPAIAISIFSRIDGALQRHHDSLEALLRSKLSQQEALLDSRLSSLRETDGRRSPRVTDMTSLGSTKFAALRSSASRPSRSSVYRFDEGKEFEFHDRRKHLRAKAMFLEHANQENEGIQETDTKSPLLRFSKRCKDMVFDSRFNLVFAVLIFINVVFTGIQVELRASRFLQDDGAAQSSGDVLSIIAMAFIVIFWAEMLLRMFAQGAAFFLRGDEYAWNCFDVVINVASAGEAVLSVLVTNDSTIAKNAKLARLLRAVRMLRMVRAVRLFRVFRQLRILVLAIVSALKAGAWTLLLLGAIIYAFGTMFTAGVIDAMEENPEADFKDELLPYFGSMSRSMFTLFEAICGGIDWGDAADRLGDASMIYMLMFYVYIAVTSMIVMNVMTGVFVQSATESAQLDSEQVLALNLADNDRYAKRLAEICDHLDPSNSGVITLDRLEVILEDQAIMSYFSMIELDLTDAWSLFRVLDTKEVGALTVDEFARGCLRLRGGARRVDMSNMMYTSNWIMNKLARFSQSTEDNLQEMFEILNGLSMEQKAIKSRLAQGERSVAKPMNPERSGTGRLSRAWTRTLDGCLLSLPPLSEAVGGHNEAESDQVPVMPWPKGRSTSPRDDLGRITQV